MNTTIKNNKYIFDPVAKTIKFVGLSETFLQGVYAIFNVTDGICIYDFGDPNKTGTLENNTLLLKFDTSSMSSTDSLLIKYDDGNILGVDVATKVQDESIPLLRRVVRLLESQANVDSANRQRIILDAISGGLTLAALTTVTQVGNIQAVVGVGQQQFADPSRTCYNVGIRSKLIFS